MVLSVGLGIDVGGTNTDAALVDLKEKKVLSFAKAPTTKDDLARGISDVLNRLDRLLFPKIGLVSLSTTLATNSIVEGKRRRVRGFLIGYTPDLYPTAFKDEAVLISGGHTVHGDEKDPLDIAKIKQVLEQTKGEMDAYAVCGYFSVRNPDHELRVKKLVQEMTDKPVVCGHEISLQLDAVKRATTTLLNAHLIPIIWELFDSVKRVFKEQKIAAPLMIVKGDGSLVSESAIRERPIETILSGPAASVIGAKYLLELSGETQNAVIVDIGGTTTDIAQLKEGSPRLNPEGAKVGDWKTNVVAIDIRTIGLGGDSQISVDTRGSLQVGPRRVIPLSYLAYTHPRVNDELVRLSDLQGSLPYGSVTDFWIPVKPAEGNSLSPLAREILSYFSGHPLSLLQLVGLTGRTPSEVLQGISTLERLGIIQQSGLTPTDVLHVIGIFQAWNRETAELAVRIFCKRHGIGISSLHQKLGEAMDRQMGVRILELLLPHSVSKLDDCEFCNLFLDHTFRRTPDHEGVRFGVSIRDRLIGIGAPAHAFLPSVAEKLGTQAIVPFYAGVANAIGAITSAVLVQEEILIKPFQVGFRLHSSAGMTFFTELTEATDHGKKLLHDVTLQKAKKSGAGDVEVVMDEKDIWVTLETGAVILIERKITARGMGNPRLYSDESPIP